MRNLDSVFICRAKDSVSRKHGREFLMQKNGIFPNVVRGVVDRAMHDGNFYVEHVGKIIDHGVSIAEKMIIIRGKNVITVFRAKPIRIGDFVALTYDMEKYPVDNAEKIYAEIGNLRKEWTSGIWCGNNRVW